MLAEEIGDRRSVLRFPPAAEVAILAPVPLTRRQIATLADRLPAVVAALTGHRSGRGAQWVAVDTLLRDLRRHGVAVTADDLQAAVAIAVERRVLAVEGDPPHSVAVREDPRRWLGG